MMEQPEVVAASEVKNAAESAAKQACTLTSGLLHDCQFSSVENKNRRKKALSKLLQPIQEQSLLSILPEIVNLVLISRTFPILLPFVAVCCGPLRYVKTRMFSLPTLQIPRLSQWPSAADTDATRHPLASEMHGAWVV